MKTAEPQLTALSLKKRELLALDEIADGDDGHGDLRVLLGWLAELLSPLTRRLFGPEINRRTEENVAAAGLEIFDVRREGVWREIVARPPRVDGRLQPPCGCG